MEINLIDIDIYTTIDALIVLSILFLAILSLLRGGYKNPTNRLFAGVGVLIAIWMGAGDIGVLPGASAQLTLITQYIATFASSVTEIFMLLFIASLAGVKNFSKLLRILLPFFWVMAFIAITPLVIESITLQGPDLGYIVNYGPLAWLYFATIIFGVILMIYEFVLGLRSTDGVQRRQIKIAGISLALTVFMIILMNIIIPVAFEYYELDNYAYFPMLFLAIGLYYSAVRYQLFDIRLAAVRTLTYVLSLSMLAGIYYSAALIASDIFSIGDGVVSQNPLSIILAFILLLAFQPVKQFFDHWTNRLFYRHYYDSNAFLGRFNKILTSTNNLSDLLDQTTKEIASTMKSEFASFYVYPDKKHSKAEDTNNKFSYEDITAIKKAMGGKHNMIIAPMLDSHDKLYELTTKHRIEVVIPLVHSGQGEKNDLIGFLFLGEHLTSHYTNRDIKILSVIADSLVIAIENAMSVDAVRKSNIELRKIDKMKDEFISIASHELRTPMTIISGYISLLQRGSIGSEDSGQRAILERASQSTKNLINLVNNMLDLSRLKADKLDVHIEPHSIDDLINHAVDQVKMLYDGKGLTIAYDNLTKNNLTVHTDADQFDRILLNLLSNSYKFTDKGSVNITVSDKKNRFKITKNGYYFYHRYRNRYPTKLYGQPI